MWRVDDHEHAREERLASIRLQNERHASAKITIDYAERVKRATRHCTENHRQFPTPPRELYLTSGIGSTPLETIDLQSLPVTSEWLVSIANDLQATATERKKKRKPVVLPTRLCLGDTPLTDAAVVGLQRFKQLQMIDISRCFALTDESLSLIRRQFSSTLEELDITECRHFTSDCLNQVWRDCSKLHTLRARSCSAAVTDAFLQCVATTKRSTTTTSNSGQPQGLRVLDIRHCKNVTSSGISHLATSSLKNMAITSLWLSDCLEVDNMAFFGFENSTSLNCLVSLDLSGLRVDETGISWIAKGCATLEQLNLSRCRMINDFALLLLSPLLSNRLRTLNLKACVLISDHGFKNLFTLEEQKRGKEEEEEEDGDTTSQSIALQVLNVEGCHLIGDETLHLLGRHSGNLTKLNLRGLRKVSDAGVLSIAKGCAQLGSIKLSGRHLTDQTFKILGKLCARLTRLDISERLDVQTPKCLQSLTSGIHPERFVKLNFGSTNICDLGVAILASKCPQLQWINLSKCPRVTDTGIETIAYHCHSLHGLLLANTSAITDRSLIALAMMRLPLQTVDLCGNTNITENGIHVLCWTCQTIHELRLKGCGRLSFATLQRASKCLPLTRVPIAPTLSQAMASGGSTNSVSAVLTPLAPRHLSLIQLLVARYESACVLQAKFRRWKQKEASTLFLARRKFQRETRAARKIQKCIRGFLSWRKYFRMLQLERNLSQVVYVQAHIKGNQSRHRTRIFKFTAHHAAKIIQRSYRPHYMVRMRVRHAHAVTIQRIYRGHKGRQAFHDKQQERRRTCAEQIWKWYRKCLHQRQTSASAKWLVHKIHNIQGQWRKYMRRKNLTYYLNYYRHRVTLIQKRWRGFSTRRRVRLQRIQWTAAAIVIQRIYRAHRIRCIVHLYRWKANDNAVLIQKTWKRFANQKKYHTNRKRIIHSQRMARYAIAVYKLRRVVYAALSRHRNQTALAIQRVVRGHFGRRRAVLFRKIRNAVASKKGQNASQAWMRQGFIRNGAAIRLQRFLRQYQARRKMLQIKKWRRVVASRCLQRYMKDWIRRLKLQRKREAQRHGSITVQRVYRWYVGRVAFQQEKHRQDCVKSARLLQRVYRGVVARRMYRQLRKEMVAAARMLQRAYRGRNTRKLYEIAQATAALKAKEKYEKSILGRIDAKRNPMDELYRRAKLPKEKELFQKLHEKWDANRVSQERAVRKISREYKSHVWPATQELVGNHLNVRKKLYGVTENVYVSHREYLERQERQAQLTNELVDLHLRVRKCQQALRDAVASQRMLDGKDVMDILSSFKLLESAVTNQVE